MTGPFDLQMHFDGTGYVEWPVDPVDLDAVDFAVGGWFKTASTGFRLMQNRGTGGLGAKAGFQISATNATDWGNTSVDDGQGNSASFGSVSFNEDDGNWHHVLLRWVTSTGTAELFINGILKGTQVNAAMINANLNGLSWRLGAANQSAQYFVGDAHDWRAWTGTEAPTTAEIGKLSDPTKATLAALSTALHVKGEQLLDASGGNSTVYDSSGGGKHGTAYGGVTTSEDANFSFARDVGYSDGTVLQGTYIPRDESTRNLSAILDVFGGTLQHGPPETFTLDISAGQFFQRPANGDLSTTVSGVCTYSELIEYQIDSGARLSLTTAAGGTYSGNANLPVGNHTLSVRRSSEPANPISVSIHIGDAFGWFGQNNADGYLDNSQPYTGSLGFWIYDEDDAWIAGTSGYISPGSTGEFSVLPRLASLIEASTGAPVAFICETQGSAGITTGPWNSNPPGANYSSAIAALGDSKTNAIRAVLIDTGEADAAGPTVTAAAIETAFAEFHTDLEAAVSMTFPLILTQTGTTHTASTAANTNAVRQGQQAAVDSNTQIHFGSVGYDRNGLHWQTDAEAITQAERLFAAIDEAVFSGTDGSPPRLESAVVDGTSLTLTYDRDLEPATSYIADAWAFESNGTDIAITAATKEGSRTVELTLAAAPTSTALTLSLGSGNSAQGDAIPRGLGNQPVLPGTTLAFSDDNAPFAEVLSVKKVQRVISIS